MLAFWICRERISRVRKIVCNAKITPSTTNAPSTKVSTEFMVSHFIKSGKFSGLRAEVQPLFCQKNLILPGASGINCPSFSERRGQRRANRVDGRRETGAARHLVPRRAAERPRGARAHLRQDALKLHPHLRRRQGERRDVALRPQQGAHHLPAQ